MMLVVIVLATFVSGKRVQLPALVAHAGVLSFAAGIAVSSVSRRRSPEFTAGSAGDAGRIHLPF
ncbi:hypothetical protein ACVXHA_07470 [Escherichia coli]